MHCLMEEAMGEPDVTEPARAPEPAAILAVVEPPPPEPAAASARSEIGEVLADRLGPASAILKSKQGSDDPFAVPASPALLSATARARLSPNIVTILQQSFAMLDTGDG